MLAVIRWMDWLELSESELLSLEQWYQGYATYIHTYNMYVLAEDYLQKLVEAGASTEQIAQVAAAVYALSGGQTANAVELIAKALSAENAERLASIASGSSDSWTMDDDWRSVFAGASEQPIGAILGDESFEGSAFVDAWDALANYLAQASGSWFIGGTMHQLEVLGESYMGSLDSVTVGAPHVPVFIEAPDSTASFASPPSLPPEHDSFPGGSDIEYEPIPAVRQPGGQSGAEPPVDAPPSETPAKKTDIPKSSGTNYVMPPGTPRLVQGHERTWLEQGEWIVRGDGPLFDPLAGVKMLYGVDPHGLRDRLIDTAFPPNGKMLQNYPNASSQWDWNTTINQGIKNFADAAEIVVSMGFTARAITERTVGRAMRAARRRGGDCADHCDNFRQVLGEGRDVKIVNAHGLSLETAPGVNQSGEAWQFHAGVLLEDGRVADPFRGLVFESVDDFVVATVGDAPVNLMSDGAIIGTYP